jgi:hypothetical protein
MLVATYDWPEDLLGPAPAGWAAAQARVEAVDREALDAWLPVMEQQLRAGVTGRGEPMIQRLPVLVP